MRRLALHLGAWGLFLAANSGLIAQEERPAFLSLRYQEDYGFLREPAQRTETLDPLKFIPLDGDNSEPYLSLGGEARLMGETFRHESFSPAADGNSTYLLQRYLLHADLRLSRGFRTFAQLQSAFEAGKAGNGDENPLDLHQLFADFRLEPGPDMSLTLRPGRQELRYGSERLIGVREGTNNRRAFDAVRLLLESGETRVDLFLASPVEWDPGTWDDQALRDTWLWGAYASLPAFPRHGLSADLYYLGLQRPDAGFNQHRAPEERHTVGVRLFGGKGGWDINHEAIYQFGSYGQGRIQAWSLATDHGYTWKNAPFQPRLGLKAAIASGDRDATDEELQTFNPLYPRGNYFSEASVLGPQNFMDLSPSLSLKLTETWEAALSADFYWRQSRSDGIYRPSGSLIYPADTSPARFVGTDYSLSTTWQANRNLTLGLALTHFQAGRYVRESGGENVQYAGAWITFRF